MSTSKVLIGYDKAMVSKAVILYVHIKNLINVQTLLPCYILIYTHYTLHAVYKVLIRFVISSCIFTEYVLT